jgi:hypothetical protein
MPPAPPDWSEFAHICFPDLEVGFEEAFGSFEELIDFIIEEEERGLSSFGLDSKLCRLAEIFPDVDIELISSICNSFPDDNLDQLTDTILAHSLEEYWGKQKRKRYIRLTPEHAKLESSRTPQVQTFVDVVVSRAGLGLPFEFDFGEDFDDTDDLEELRRMAFDIQHQRRALYHHAAEAFARGQVTGRFAASYYSQEVSKVESNIRHIFWNQN